MDEDQNAPAGAAEVLLYGTVGDFGWGEEDHFTAKSVATTLRGKGDVVLRLNSGGGIATEGAAIHAVLKAHPGKVSVVVEGIAASAASLIAMAGDEIAMAEGALMMIHDPSGITIGPEEAHRRSAEVLGKMAGNYAAVYAARSGQTPEQVRALMVAETWMTAEEAVGLGFADQALAAPAAEAAAFDFQVYANAPEHLRALASERGWRNRRPATRAHAPIAKEELAMSTKEKAAAPGEAAVETTVVTGNVTAPVEMRADPAAEREAAEARRRKAVTARFGDKLTAAQAEEVATRARDEADALLMAADIVIAARMQAEGPETRTAVSITRDEVDTRRVGMEAALVARMSYRAPQDDRARAFMGMTIAEMAAECVGHRGSLRSVADRERVLMAATHSRSDFPAIFENALNKQLADRYADATPTYRDISRRMTFADFRPHPVMRAGDFPTLLELGEGGEIQYGTFSESKETVAVKSYARAIRISRQMMIDDDLNALAQIIADQGRAVARFEDATFYAMFLSGSNGDGPTLAETTRQVFNTTDKSKAGTPSVIDVTNLGIARASLRNRLGIDGAKLNVVGRILLVGPDKETQAQQVVAPIQAQQAGNVNPFSGTLTVVTSPYVTGNAWYLFADPSDLPCFIHGFLSGYEAPRMRTDEPFGQQGMAMSVEHDFGVGAIDHRGGFRNTGA
jgi:ATP-dependent protease ClpP protease subunit